jgi:Holliday junction resolvase RusA-like endonuclease
VTPISLFIPGDPKGQPRPRAFARFGHAHVYNPSSAEGWKSEIAMALKPWADIRLEGALSVEMDFQFLRPNSHFGKKGLFPSAPVYHLGKPDCDNLAKAALDAMTFIGIWHDDAQVTHLNVTKQWTTSRSGMLVGVTPATPENTSGTPRPLLESL